MQLFWDPGHGTAGPRHNTCDLVRIYLDADTGDLSGGAAITHTRASKQETQCRRKYKGMYGRMVDKR